MRPIRAALELLAAQLAGAAEARLGTLSADSGETVALVVVSAERRALR